MKIQKENGMYHVKLIADDVSNQLLPVDVSDDLDKKGLVNFNLRPAQNITIRSESDDILISHSPGKGKTFTAIMKAEKKRNELK